MSKPLHIKASDATRKHKNEHDDYEYYKRDLVPKGFAEQCAVSIYEIPPGKSAYPYHYHMKNEECFYIISGEGILKTPLGDQLVSAEIFCSFQQMKKVLTSLLILRKQNCLFIWTLIHITILMWRFIQIQKK